MTGTFNLLPMKGRVALVTGGASGIGRGVAESFAVAGAQVVVSDIDRQPGEELVAQINSRTSLSKAEAMFIATNVARMEEVESMVASAVAAYGKIDFAVNSAGIGGTRARTADYPEDVWRRVIDINLNGVYYSMKAEIAQMLRQDGGVIVNIASVAGLVGFPSHSAYSASKHAVVGLTRTAALEYVRKGIRINAVCPGFIDTPMVAAERLQDPEYAQQLIRGVPARRLGAVEEVASAVLYLCSDGAAFVTGLAMALDGGITAG